MRVFTMDVVLIKAEMLMAQVRILWKWTSPMEATIDRSLSLFLAQTAVVTEPDSLPSNPFYLP